MIKPATPKPSRRHHTFLLVIASHLVAFAILLLLVIRYPFFSIDLVITQAIQRLNLPGFEILMVAVTELGNFWLGCLTTFIAVSLVIALTKKWRDGLFVIISTSGTFVISLIFKFIADRPRPDADLIHQIGQAATDPSFPSGHMLYYIGLFGFLLYLAYTKIQHQRYLVVITLTTLIFLGGLSRIYLGAHWFSDVLGSYLIGMVWLYFMAWLYRRNP